MPVPYRPLGHIMNIVGDLGLEVTIMAETRPLDVC
jgi:hypothetical protein